MNPFDENSPEPRMRRFLGQIGERLGAIWDRAIYPLEFATAWTWNRCLAAYDRLESADVVVVLLFRLVFLPFHLMMWIGRRLVPTAALTTLARIGDLFAWGVWRTCTGLWIVAERLSLDRALFWFVRKTCYLWQPAAAVIGFAVAWKTSRSVRQLWFAMPILLLLVALAMIGYRAATLDRVKLIASYRIALKEATNRNDHATVDLCERKLAYWGASTERHHYEQALVFESEGKLDEAWRAMQKLAPRDKSGYAPAHWWIVQHAFAGDVPFAVPTRDTLLDEHLHQLEERYPAERNIRLFRGLRQVERQEFTAAAETLRPLIRESYLASCHVLRLDIMENHDIELARDATAVIEHLEKHRRDGQSFHSSDYEVWALALEVKRDPAELERVLVEWNRLHPDDRRAMDALRRFTESRVEQMLESGIASPDQIAKLLNRAGEGGSKQKWLDRQVERLYQLRDHSVVATPLPERVVQLLLAADDTSSRVLQAIGTQAARVAEWERARVCFERAVATDPQAAVAWNNLAWVLAHQDAPELTAALEAAQRALAMVPGEHEFRETRGQIWLRLGRYAEAIADLEYARQGLPQSTEIEQALAAAHVARNAEVRRSGEFASE